MADCNAKPTHGNFKDLEGLAFGRWSVISLHERTGSGVKWLCRCECGVERAVKSASLLSGRSTSCGCFHKDVVAKKNPTLPPMPNVVSLSSSGKPPESGELRCSRCKQSKPMEMFAATSQPKCRRRGGRRYACKECESQAAKQPHRRALANASTKKFLDNLKATNPDEYARRIRESNLRKNYSLGHEDYERMLADQHEKCAICGTSETNGRWNRFHIDHNHATGSVRGLLCHGCNVSIGHFKDDVTLLQNAINYISKHEATA